MKKYISIMFIMLLGNINAEQYIINIEKSNYKDAVRIKCEEPLVLNTEGDHCIEDKPTCELPLVLNETQDACVSNTEAVSWINTSGDSCSGMRQSNFDPNVYFARSKTNVTNTGLEIPEGYHWVSKTEYASLFNASTVSNKSAGITPYKNQCGLSGYPVAGGQLQYVFLFSGSSTGIHAGNYEYHGVNHNNNSAGSNFAGYVLYKDF